MEPRDLTIAGAMHGMRSGELSAVELIRSVLDQIERHDSWINAYVTVADPELLLDEARRSDERRSHGEDLRPLEGIPIGIKDNFATAGLLTTAGSQILGDWVPDRDAAAVARLREAGGVIIGKLNMHEFADGITTENPHTGKTRNPWDPERTPAGSSGGSGAALIADMCLGATGSDTGGSIREPAAFCGVTGLKPTYGLVSRVGVVPFSWSLDHAGPMGKTVDDVEALLDVMAGYDPEDPGSSASPVRPAEESHGEDLEGVIVGVETSYFSAVMDPAVRKAFEDCLARLERRGARLEEVEIPSAQESLAAELAILFPEAASFHRAWLDEQPMSYGRDVRLSLLSGRLFSAVDYVEAQRLRAVMKREVNGCFETVDVLATPAMIIEPVRWGEETFELQGGTWDALDVFIRCLVAFNLTGHPALSVPCGYGELALPVGVQLVGSWFSEARLFRVGRAVERDFATERRKPSFDGRG